MNFPSTFDKLRNLSVAIIKMCRFVSYCYILSQSKPFNVTTFDRNKELVFSQIQLFGCKLSKKKLKREARIIFSRFITLRLKNSNPKVRRLNGSKLTCLKKLPYIAVLVPLILIKIIIPSN